MLSALTLHKSIDYQAGQNYHFVHKLSKIVHHPEILSSLKGIEKVKI